MEPQDRQEIVENIQYLIQAGDTAKLKNIIVDSHAADIADLLRELSEEDALEFFKLVDAEMASDVLIELDQVTREHLIDAIGLKRLTSIIDEMDSDDAADVVAELDAKVAQRVLSGIGSDDRAEVEALLRHQEDTAGGIMALEYIAVYDDQTVDDAIQEIRIRAEEIDEIFYVYAVDRGHRLVGVVPIKSLFLRNRRRMIRDVMHTDIISVDVDMDQEQVANIVQKYDLSAVPVVDRHGRLVGRITFDDIVDVMREEATEDMQRMAGITEDVVVQEMSPFRISRSRLPWLIVAFVGQLVAAFVLSKYEGTLAQKAVLIFFIPLIMAMGGNAGIQTSTVIVRSIALEGSAQLNRKSLFWREFRVAMLNAALLGILISGFFYAWQGDFLLGVTIGIALMFVIINSAAFGALIPSMLVKFEIDPAIATGPFITTTNDIIGLIIYLSLAQVYLVYTT